MFLITLMIQAIIAAFIIRFQASLYYLNGNPLINSLRQYTDGFIVLLRKIPIFDPQKQGHFRGKYPFLNKILPYDLPSLLAGFLVATLIGLIFWHSLSAGIVLFFSAWINVIYYAIFVVVIGSWLSAQPNQPVMQIALCCSEFILAPLRRIIPPLGMLDFTPVVALFLLSILSHAIEKIL